MGTHDGHRQRLRNRFLKHGLDTLEDHEVLELLLFYVIKRQDTNPLAHRLIKHFGSLAAVFDASIDELKAIEGIGDQAASLLALAKPLCRRYMISGTQERKMLNTTVLCAEYLIPLFIGMTEERAYLLCLDAKCRPITCRELSTGTGFSTDLPIRKATQIALACNAVSVVLAHNHPCGDTQPSEADYTATGEFAEAMKRLDIALVDHIIISGYSYTSMCETGYLYRS